HPPFAAHGARRRARAHAIGAPERAARVGGFALPAPEPAAAPGGHLIAYVRSGVVLRDAPFGRVVERLSGRTPFGSPQALAVVRRRRGRWLGVTAPQLGNRRLGWLDARAGGLRFARTPLELDVDLSRRLAVLHRGSHLLRRMTVGVGRPGSPTPTGRSP